MQICPVGFKYPVPHLVARVFNDYVITWIDKQTRSQIESLRRAVDNHQLLDRARQPPRLAQAGLQGLAQPLIATRVLNHNQN